MKTEPAPRPAEPSSAEFGGAIIEFLALAFMLFIPTVYFLLTVFSIQSAGLAASAASQQAIMVVKAMGDERQMNLAQAHAAAALAVADYGVSPSQLSLDATCLDAQCDRVQVAASVAVSLPLVPWLAPSGIGTMHSSATWWGGKYR